MNQVKGHSKCFKSYIFYTSGSLYYKAGIDFRLNPMNCFENQKSSIVKLGSLH